ncbi:MAG: hypothetical protein ACOCT9_00610 [archaeon]
MTEEKVEDKEEYEDLAVTGELVNALPEEERWFVIRDRPYYEQHEQQDGTKKKKVTIPITLSDGRKGLYYPNRTSERKVAALAGSNVFKNWIGLCYKWGKLLDQNVFGEQKKVPYVTERLKDMEQTK